MKPVIKKQTHYSLLLMRDDAEARTFRVHGKFLRFLIWFFLLLLVCGGGSIYGGLHYWNKYRVLVERYDIQEREANEMRLQLEQLVAYKTVLNASNATMPVARHTEVGLSAPASPNRNATAAASTANATATVNATRRGNATLPGAGNATLRSSNATRQANATSGRSGNATGPQPQEPALPSLSSNDSPLRITGFNGKATGQQRLRISYELSTEGNEEQRMISGMARYFAVFSNGTRLELSAYDSDGSRFSITRMKLMQSSARLPQGYRAGDVEKIDVVIELSEGKRFEDRYEVSGN